MSILGRQFGSKHTARWRLDLRLLECELRTMYFFFVSATPPSNLVAFVLFKFELFALPFQEIQIRDAWPTIARGTRWCVALDGVWLPMARGP